MLTPERHGELEFVTVHVDQVEEAVGSIKTTLPDEERRCSTCEYVGSTARWGLKTYATTRPERVALVLCCPSCETHVDLPEAVE